MSVTLLDQTPPTLHRKLGPYRRADYAVLPDETRCEASGPALRAGAGCGRDAREQGLAAS